MELWRAAAGHPDWPSTRPVLRVVDGYAYPTDSPDADPDRRWYRIDHNLVYRSQAHPDGASTTPDYRIIGTFIYRADTPARGPAFEIVDRRDDA